MCDSRILGPSLSRYRLHDTLHRLGGAWSHRGIRRQRALCAQWFIRVLGASSALSCAFLPQTHIHSVHGTGRGRRYVEWDEGPSPWTNSHPDADERHDGERDEKPERREGDEPEDDQAHEAAQLDPTPGRAPPRLRHPERKLGIKERVAKGVKRRGHEVVARLGPGELAGVGRCAGHRQGRVGS